MKICLALAGALLLGGSLAACGGGDDDGQASGYCKDARKAAPTFDDFGNGDIAKAESAFAQFHGLAGKAPAAVEDEWKKLDDAITDIEAAFADAGLKIKDLKDVRTGEVPEGVDTSKLAALGTEFQKLSDADFTRAAKDIDAHAKKVCKVNLHVSS